MLNAFLRVALSFVDGVELSLADPHTESEAAGAVYNGVLKYFLHHLDVLGMKFRPSLSVRSLKNVVATAQNLLALKSMQHS